MVKRTWTIMIGLFKRTVERLLKVDGAVKAQRDLQADHAAAQAGQATVLQQSVRGGWSAVGRCEGKMEWAVGGCSTVQRKVQRVLLPSC